MNSRNYPYLYFSPNWIEVSSSLADPHYENQHLPLKIYSRRTFIQHYKIITVPTLILCSKVAQVDWFLTWIIVVLIFSIQAKQASSPAFSFSIPIRSCLINSAKFVVDVVLQSFKCVRRCKWTFDRTYSVKLFLQRRIVNLRASQLCKVGEGRIGAPRRD